jgi:hypothetical protein
MSLQELQTHHYEAGENTTMTVYVLHAEGNTDFYSEVLGVYATEAQANLAKRTAISEAHADGYVVEGEEDPDAEGDKDWDRSYSILPFEVKE